MAVVKFSHKYPKLHNQTSALLISVRPIKIDENTPKELIEYDTKYDGGYFKLPYGNYVQLVFLGNFGIPFTTIREHYPPHKEDFYEGTLGETFDIVIRKAGLDEKLRKATNMKEKDFDDNVSKFMYDLIEQMQTSEKIMYDMENETWERLKNRGSDEDFKAYNNMDSNGRAVWCYNHDSEYRTYAIRYFALKKLRDTLSSSHQKEAQ